MNRSPSCWSSSSTATRYPGRSWCSCNRRRRRTKGESSPRRWKVRRAGGSGISRLSVRAGENRAELYQARFVGPLPGIKTKDGAVSIRYPRRLLDPGGRQGVAEVALNVAVPWRVSIQGGATEAVAELSSLNLAGLEIKGGFNTIRLDLPAPSGMVPIRITGGAPEIAIHGPAGIAARINFKGRASKLVFDGQVSSVAGNSVLLQGLDFGPSAPCATISKSQLTPTWSLSPLVDSKGQGGSTPSRYAAADRLPACPARAGRRYRCAGRPCPVARSARCQ